MKTLFGRVAILFIGMLLVSTPLIGARCQQDPENNSNEEDNQDLSMIPATIESQAASNVTSNSATLNGLVTNPGNVNFVSTDFEWGRTTTYEFIAGVSVQQTNFQTTISGLSPNTLYHFRAVVQCKFQSEYTYVYGADQTFTTLPPPIPLTLTASTLALGIVSEQYSSEITALGGLAPYSFSLSAGALPAGLRLNSLSDRCKIEGTPSEYGEFSFTITVRDGTSTASAVFKMTVFPNLAGKWAFNTTVTAAGGQCSEEVGRVTNTPITVVQTGTSVNFYGWVGNPTSLLSGTISTPSALTGGKWLITISGNYPEDGGTTTATRTLTLDSPTSMSGDETWSWSGPGGDCTGGLATMTATKIS